MKNLAVIALSLMLTGCASSPAPDADKLSRGSEEEINRRVSAAIIERQDAEDVTRTPGFETTTKSGREVLQIALDYARKSGEDLHRYRAPTINLFKKEGKMVWLVSWDLKGMPIPGGFFGVLIDDATGAIEDVPGM